MKLGLSPFHFWTSMSLFVMTRCEPELETLEALENLFQPQPNSNNNSRSMNCYPLFSPTVYSMSSDNVISLTSFCYNYEMS